MLPRIVSSYPIFSERSLPVLALAIWTVYVLLMFDQLSGQGALSSDLCVAIR